MDRETVKEERKSSSKLLQPGYFIDTNKLGNIAYQNQMKKRSQYSFSVRRIKKQVKDKRDSSKQLPDIRNHTNSVNFCRKSKVLSLSKVKKTQEKINGKQNWFQPHKISKKNTQKLPLKLSQNSRLKSLKTSQKQKTKIHPQDLTKPNAKNQKKNEQNGGQIRGFILTASMKEIQLIEDDGRITRLVIGRRTMLAYKCISKIMDYLRYQGVQKQKQQAKNKVSSLNSRLKLTNK